MVLAQLLDPRQWRPPEDRKFVLNIEQIAELCEDAERIFKDEPTVLHLHGKFVFPVTLSFHSGPKYQHWNLCDADFGSIRQSPAVIGVGQFDMLWLQGEGMD